MKLLIMLLLAAELSWPAPPGFRSETLPFPLSFAPQLRYQGVEEIRFAPGFGKPGEPGYFTYSFVWVLKESAELDLEEDLQAYFYGLMQAVGKQDPPPFPTTADSRALKGQGFEKPAYVATVKTWDAFYTKAPLELTLEVFRLSDVLYYFEVSPSPQSRRLLLPLRGALKL